MNDAASAGDDAVVGRDVFDLLQTIRADRVNIKCTQTSIMQQLDHLEDARAHDVVERNRVISGITETTNHVQKQLRYIDERRFTSTCTRVFNTPELLEHILLYPPTLDLLLAPQISKKFRPVVEGSPKIQQALFFTPEPPPCGREDPRINHLVFGKGSPSLKNISLCFHHGRMTMASRKDAAILAPLAIRDSHIVGGNTKSTLEVYLGMSRREAEQFDPSTSSRSISQHVSRAARAKLATTSGGGASWRRMYASQPPPTEIKWFSADNSTMLGCQDGNAPLGQIIPVDASVDGINVR